MGRSSEKIRILPDGRLEVIDPSFEDIPLLLAVDPGYQVQMAPLPGFTVPRFLRLREVGIGLGLVEVESLPEEDLWAIHRDLMGRPEPGVVEKTRSTTGATLIDLKSELARRILARCRLCSHECGVDRLWGERGVCGLGREALVANHFVHIAEEPPFNPSLLLCLAGCALRCRFCQQHPLLNTTTIRGVRLDPALWSDLDHTGARSLSFAGGNPDESLHAVLEFLRDAPGSWSLPIVWNCHGYASTETMTLLEGVIDVFVPDFKYGCESCARSLSGAPHYPQRVRASIARMLSMGVPVIVRLLVLPGHFDCCHAPALRTLAELDGENLLISVRDQYCPDFEIASTDGPLARRPRVEEIVQVVRLSKSLGLKLVEEKEE